MLVSAVHILRSCCSFVVELAENTRDGVVEVSLLIYSRDTYRSSRLSSVNLPKVVGGGLLLLCISVFM